MAKSKVLKLELLLIEQTDAFRMAAQTLCRSHSALGAFYRRMQARLGAPKAITAAAHNTRFQMGETFLSRANSLVYRQLC